MDCRELVAAIDALASLVVDHKDHPFDDSEVERLNELDARVYALAAQAGLAIPQVAQIGRATHRPYGNTQIISSATNLGRYFHATSNWRQAMAGLRARAELQIENATTNVSTADQSITASSSFSSTDRFPATPAGHIAFLEDVCGEIHNAAEAKRQQLAEAYSNATIESMVRGIKWAEAGQRVSLLSNLPAEPVEQVARVLRRELTVGTVEQIDDLFTPAVRNLRDAYEDSNNTVFLTGNIVESHLGKRNTDRQADENHIEIRTVGDLWKALNEGKTPAVLVSAISCGPPFGQNIAQPNFPKTADQSNWDVLDRALALCDAEEGDREEAMRKLIARIALARQADRRQIINMPLAEFVEAAAGQGEPEPAGERGPAMPTGFLGGAALADALGIYPKRRDAFFRQLERQRKSLGDDYWHEVRDPRPNTPRFLYRVDSPKLCELAAAYKNPKPA